MSQTVQKSRVYTDRPAYADFDAPKKFQTIQSIIAERLVQHPNAICSYSGGSDSDIMLHLIESTRALFHLPPVHYCFFNTGLEMEAIKQHKGDMEKKYGVSIPEYRPKKNIVLATREYSLYEATQMQRKMERSIRKQKKRILVDKATGDEEKLQIDQTKLRMQNANYKKFSDAAGLRTQRERTFVAGGGRKEAEETAKAKAKPKEQFYRPVNRGESSSFQIRNDQSVAVRKVDSYENVYISDKAKIKPKALHDINQNTEAALKEWGVDLSNKPGIVIVSPDEFSAFGKYDPVENVVYYTPQIADAATMKDNGGLGFVEYHEMWHMKQADDFRKAGWTITQENRGRYIEELCKESKKRLDKAGVGAYNVREISDYASNKFWEGRYDEVEADYMTVRRVNRHVD